VLSPFYAWPLPSIEDRGDLSGVDAVKGDAKVM